jgi:hypothetical protein
MRLTALLPACLSVVIGVLPSPVVAADTKVVLQIQGATDLSHDEPHEDRWDSRNQLEIAVDGAAGEALRYKVSGRFKGDFYGDGDVDQDVDLEVYETYLKYRAERFDLKAGNLVVQWGKMDELVLTDNVNAQDLDQFILPWKEDRKLATPMVQTEMYLGDTTVELLVSPRPAINRITFFDADWAFFRHNRELGAGMAPDAATAGFFDALNVDADAPDWGDVEGGGRVRSTVGDVDFALSALVHHQRTPVFRGDALTLLAAFDPEQALPLLSFAADVNALPSPEITASYPWVITLGGALETTLGDYGVRAEVAHTLGAEYQAADLSVVEADQTLIGLGVDVTLNAFYGNLQVVQQWVQEDSALLLVGKQAATVVATLEYEVLQGTLTPALFLAWDLGDNASYWRPRILYKQSDHLTLDLGLHVITGDEDTALGSFDAYDQAYLLATLSF